MNNSMNEKYEIKINEIKAALLDIVVIESQKLEFLKKQLAVASDETEKGLLEKQYVESNDAIDNTLDNINNIIEELEKLNKINDTIPIEENDSKKEIKQIDNKDITAILYHQEKPLDLEKEDNIKTDEENPKEDASTTDIEQNSDTEEQIEEKEDNVKTDEENSKEDDSTTDIEQNSDIEEQAEEKEDNVKTDEENSKEDDSTTDIEEQIEEKENNIKTDEENPKEDETNIKDDTSKENELLSFKKATNVATKAILVRQDQLSKLQLSKEKQKGIVTTLGVFKNYQAPSPTVDPASNGMQEESNSQVVNNEDPQDIERQIEDLMVKVNIYNGEGETAKVQELNNKINELKNKLSNNSTNN